jgi:hypothetical protein
MPRRRRLSLSGSKSAVAGASECYRRRGAGCVEPPPEEYDYSAAPAITQVSPSFVSENGGSTAVITGSGFNLLTFEYANVGSAGPRSSEDFDIEGITPTTLTLGIPGAGQSVEPDQAALSVVSAGQLSNVSSLEYAGTPQLSSISSHLVAQSDPGTLTITGTGLSDVQSVVFQGRGTWKSDSATSGQISSQSDTQLTVAVPSFYAVPTDVLVCTATGCSPPDPATDALTFAYPGRPVVTSSGPSSGPAAGGTTVTIEGTLDSELTSVDFGSAPAKIPTEPVGSPSGAITVIAPRGHAGETVPITISTLGGQLVSAPKSAVTQAASFTYTAVPPPNTTITHFVISSSEHKATFDFKGSGGVGTLRFQCKLDSGAWKTCASPTTYTGLARGKHTFQVRAIDSRGDADRTPAMHTFAI